MHGGQQQRSHCAVSVRWGGELVLKCEVCTGRLFIQQLLGCNNRSVQTLDAVTYHKIFACRRVTHGVLTHLPTIGGSQFLSFTSRSRCDLLSVGTVEYRIRPKTSEIIMENLGYIVSATVVYVTEEFRSLCQTQLHLKW